MTTPERVFAYRAETALKKDVRGPLSGLKIAVQPNLAVCDWPQDAGSKALEKFTSLENAAVVNRLLNAGAEIAGTVFMGELGFGLVGDTAAGALESGGCDAVIMNDTFGEPRYVSVESGGVAVKPSFGICSRLGLNGLVPSMESPSVIAADIKTAGKIAASMAGVEEADFSMLKEGIPDFAELFSESPSAKSAGVISEAVNLLNKDETAAFHAAVQRLKDAGVAVKEISFPDFELFRKVHNVVGSVEASSSAGKYDGVRYGHRASGTDNWNEMYIKSREESFGTLVKAYLFQGGYFQYENYPAFEDACRLRRKLVEELNSLFEDLDLLLLPVRKTGEDVRSATKVNDIYDAFAMTCGANVAGLPAVSMRIPGADLEHDPGIQIFGAHGDDVRIINSAVRLGG